MLTKPLSFLLIYILLFTPGCGIGILAAGIGYAVSSSKKATADQTASEAKIIEAKAKLNQSYSDYCNNLEKINLEREKSGLKPSHILDKDSWIQSHIQLKPEEVSVAK